MTTLVLQYLFVICVSTGSMEWSMGLNWGGGGPYWYSGLLLGIHRKEHHPGINSFTSHEPLDHYRLDFGELSSVIHHPTWWQVSRILPHGVFWTRSENSSLYIKFFNIQTVSVCRQTSTQIYYDNTCIFSLDGFFFFSFLYWWTLKVNLDHGCKSKMMSCVQTCLKGSTRAHRIIKSSISRIDFAVLQLC